MQKTNYYKRTIPGFSLDTVLVGRFYDSDMQKRLHRYKFVHNPVDSVYFQDIFTWLIKEASDSMHTETVIVYPPVSLKDRIIRWPNHAKKLSKIVQTLFHSKEILCPFYKNFFAGHQSRRNKSERQKIVSEYGALFLERQKIFGKEVILVDDVISTGYTAHILWKILKEELGATVVTGIFLTSQKI